MTGTHGASGSHAPDTRSRRRLWAFWKPGRRDRHRPARAPRLLTAACTLFLSVTLSAGTKEQPEAPPALARHLRLAGSQLDLRGVPLGERDLATLDHPVFRGVTSALLARSGVSDAGVAYLRLLPLEELDLYRTPITDEALAHLGALPLKRLTLSGTAITGAGLAHLRDTPLETLLLRDTRVTDAALVHLRGVPLRQLDLSYTAVTDEGVRSLSGASHLELLDLSTTAITDGALPLLRELTSLRWLTLFATKVTAEGVAALRRVRPELGVLLEAPTR